MSKPAKPLKDQLNLFAEADLDALVASIEASPAIPNARDVATEFREFHGWTIDKLDIFEMYLKLYRRVAGSGAFIDGFAGTGHGEHVRNGATTKRDGSSLIASKSGAFSSLHLIELDAARYRTLNKAIETLTPRQREKITVQQADCNDAIPQLLAGDTLDQARPCFALLDQDSTQLAWSTIETLSKWKTYEPPEGRGRPKSCKVELWILFNSHQAVTRLWPHDHEKYPESFSPETLDRIMGGRDAWWDLWQTNQPFSRLIDRFAERLRELGYIYAIPQLICDPDNGRPQYHMFHVTDHPSAITLMRWAKRAVSGFENVALPGI